MLLQQLHRRDGLSKVEHDVEINIKMNFVGQLGNIFLFKIVFCLGTSGKGTQLCLQ